MRYMVSFFKAPIWNKWPMKTVSLFWVWMYVTMKWLQLGSDSDRDISLISKTEQLRRLTEENAQRQYKGHNFDYVTPSGSYTYCDDKSLVEYSNALCLDFDHLDDDTEVMKFKIDPEELKSLLLTDPYWGEQILLVFTSPRGHGLKVFLPINLAKCDYKTWFIALRSYFMTTYGFGDKQVDPSVSNESHACFISYDPLAYLRADLYEFYI